MFTVLLLLAPLLMLVARPFVFVCALVIGSVFGLVAQVGQVQVDLTQELIGSLASIGISLICSYMPGVAPKFIALSEDWKRLIMLGLMALVTVVIMAAGCNGILGGVDCSQNGIVHAVLIFLSAAITNQTTNSLSPRVGYRAKAVAKAVLPAETDR